MQQKRFQSGREVMHQYIRNYEANLRSPGPDYDHHPTILSGERLAESLVDDLKKALDSLGSKSAKSAPRTP